MGGVPSGGVCSWAQTAVTVGVGNASARRWRGGQRVTRARRSVSSAVRDGASSCCGTVTVIRPTAGWWAKTSHKYLVGSVSFRFHVAQLNTSRADGDAADDVFGGSRIRQAYWWAHLFHTMMKARRATALGAWVRQAETSGMPEFVRFAAEMRRDHAAVLAALQEPWSQGPTEGFNHKVKRIKRLLYGQAHFDLIRARILQGPL